MEIREPFVAYGKNKFTEEEYLQLERTSTEKHEFYRGEIFQMHGHGELLAMSGAGENHNIIFANLFGELAYKLKGKRCRPFGPDMRLKIFSNTLYTYPDISIYCKKPVDLPGDDNASDPTAIIEILSPSTRDYDMGGKFNLYRGISTLKEYILIDSQDFTIYAFRINNTGYWELEEYKDLNDVLAISSIGFTIPIPDIYEGVKF